MTWGDIISSLHCLVGIYQHWKSHKNPKRRVLQFQADLWRKAAEDELELFKAQNAGDFAVFRPWTLKSGAKTMRGGYTYLIIYIYLYVKIGEMYILQSILYFAFLFQRNIYIYIYRFIINFEICSCWFPFPSSITGLGETSAALRVLCPATCLTLHQASHLKNIRGIVEQNYQRENQEMKLSKIAGSVGWLWKWIVMDSWW